MKAPLLHLCLILITLLFAPTAQSLEITIYQDGKPVEVLDPFAEAYIGIPFDQFADPKAKTAINYVGINGKELPAPYNKRLYAQPANVYQKRKQWWIHQKALQEMLGSSKVDSAHFLVNVVHDGKNIRSSKELQLVKAATEDAPDFLQPFRSALLSAEIPDRFNKRYAKALIELQEFALECPENQFLNNIGENFANLITSTPIEKFDKTQRAYWPHYARIAYLLNPADIHEFLWRVSGRRLRGEANQSTVQQIQEAIEKELTVEIEACQSRLIEHLKENVRQGILPPQVSAGFQPHALPRELANFEITSVLPGKHRSIELFPVYMVNGHASELWQDQEMRLLRWSGGGEEITISVDLAHFDRHPLAKALTAQKAADTQTEGLLPANEDTTTEMARLTLFLRTDSSWKQLKIDNLSELPFNENAQALLAEHSGAKDWILGGNRIATIDKDIVNDLLEILDSDQPEAALATSQVVKEDVFISTRYPDPDIPLENVRLYSHVLDHELLASAKEYILNQLDRLNPRDGRPPPRDAMILGIAEAWMPEGDQ